MAPEPDTARICGEEIVYAPSRCTRPPNHGGMHESEHIPEQLGGAVAAIVAEQDKLRSARASFEEERETWRHRARLLSVIGGAAIGANIALAVTFLLRIVTSA